MNREHIAEIFRIARVLTDLPPRADEKGTSAIQRSESWLLVAYVILLVVLGVTTIGAKHFGWSGDLLVFLVKAGYGVLLVVFASYVLVVVGGIIYSLLRHKGSRHASVMERIEINIGADLAALNELSRYRKEELKYVLLEYQAQWEVMEARASLIVGDLRKLGLVPALIGSAFALSKLSAEGANVAFWVLVILGAALYIVAFAAHASRERIKHVIELLKHAIDHPAKDETPSSTSDVGLPIGGTSKVDPPDSN